jgi:PAS domain S-box-containing protein
LKTGFLGIGILAASCFWLIESCIHYYANFDESFEIVPSGSNELWMRVFICLILVLFGWYTEHNKRTSQEILRRSEKRYRDLADASPDLVWQINPEGIVTYISPSVKDITGFEQGEVIGKSYVDFLTEKGTENSVGMLKDRIQGKNRDKNNAYELSCYRKDGSVFTAETRSTPIFDKDGELIGIQGITRDITERKKVETTLRKRINELSCLYSISHLIEGATNVQDVLQGTVDLIHRSWHYPDITAARLYIDGQTFRSHRDCGHSCEDCAYAYISQPIYVYEQPLGDIRVCYTKEQPEADEGPFQKEERALINAIAERMGNVTEKYLAETEVMHKSQEYLYNLPKH